MHFGGHRTECVKTRLGIESTLTQIEGFSIANSIDAQISYASTMAGLSDRTRFRKYFRNNLPIAAPALRYTMNHFKWTRIAILTQDESLFTAVSHVVYKLNVTIIPSPCLSCANLLPNK